MTKLIILLTIFLPVVVFSQNVAINNDESEPHPSALLDISSTEKGVLLPRLTTLERLGINDPATGLTVFDKNTLSTWIYRGINNGGWAEQQHHFQNFWNTDGQNIFNNNLGNVGIGTNNPAGTLTINGTNPSLYIMNEGLANSGIEAVGFDMKMGTAIDNVSGNVILNTRGIDRLWLKENGRLGLGTSNPNSLFTMNGINPMMQLQHLNNNRGFIGVDVSHFILGTNAANISGNLVFQTRELDRMTIQSDGKIGVGTSSPSSVFTVNGANPWIEIQNGGVDKGFMQALGDDLKIGTNSTNLTGRVLFATKLVNRMVIDENGKVAIGTTSPASSILTINDNEPLVQLQNNGSSKGFIQLLGDDIKLGTNNANATGKVVLRTHGHDRLKIDHSGFVTIGNSSSGALSIHSDQPTLFLQKNNLTMGAIYSDESNGNMVINKSLAGGGKLLINTGVSSMYMNSTGHINFGNGLVPAGYKVSVEGKVIATEFTTAAINNWPDYVFSDTYHLKPLSEVKEFIKENKHLPNIPPASDVEKNGIELGDMTKKLMEKVEELTLYILQLQEQVDELKKNQNK